MNLKKSKCWRLGKSNYTKPVLDEVMEVYVSDFFGLVGRAGDYFGIICVCVLARDGKIL